MKDYLLSNKKIAELLKLHRGLRQGRGLPGAGRSAARDAGESENKITFPVDVFP